MKKGCVCACVWSAGVTKGCVCACVWCAGVVACEAWGLLDEWWVKCDVGDM